MNYDWDFRVFYPYLGAFLRGTLVTIELSVLSSLIGTVLGGILALALRLPYCGKILRLVNDVFRAIPLLVLLFFFYYFPYQQVFVMEPPSAFFAAFGALTLAQTNFTADVVRGAIDGVSQKTILGARALGLREMTIWWHIILPDVIRQVLPTMMAFYIGNIKLSSLASVIGCEEVVYVARLAVGQTFRTLEAWVLVALIYVVLVLPCTILAAKLEKSQWLLRRS